MRPLRRAGRLIVAATLLAVALAAGPAAPSAAAATDDLTLTTSATYTLVPARHLVQVVVDVTARNDKPNRVSGGVVTRYFFDAFRIGVQPEARSIRASSGGQRLTVATTTSARYITAEVRFRGSVFFGQTAKVRVTYDLPGGKPRSSSEVRVGPAFATFVAWAFGDRGSVRIVVPRDFETDSIGSDVTRELTSNATVLTAPDITDVSAFYLVVNADRPVGLTDVDVTLPEGEQLLIRAWPDDPTWRTEVTDLLTRGLPELVKATGLDWPVTDQLSIFEVHTPLLEGYAGVFFEGENRIEVSEDLDDLTIIHEASHAWFNRDLFDGRWINEGFADTYAAQALDAIGDGGWKPGDVSPTGKGAVKLNDWTFPGRISDAGTEARERFGYDASWTVVRSIVDEVGPDRMRDVLRAASTGQIPYVGTGTPETLDGAVDWRRLLDLFDEVGKSTSADDLFRTWVVGGADRGVLDRRAAARASYAELVRHGIDWVPPIAIRRPMADWSFDVAAARIKDAEAVLAKRDALTDLAGDLGLPVSDALRQAYESGGPFGRATAIADQELNDLRAIDAATAAVTARRDPIVQIGLLGSQPEALLAKARAAFVAGSSDTASQAAAASALIAGAADVGRGRLVLGLSLVTLAVVLLILVAVFAQQRLRRGGATRLAAPAASLPEAGPSDAPTPYATLADPPLGTA
ncbi:MAG TPA: hypothetical protein VIK65_06475, partial [Candidatus Limnocylindrales bacterium]